MSKKLGKEIKLDDNFNIKSKYGTINHKTLKSAYLLLETWLEPKEEMNFDKRTVSIRKRLYNEIYEKLDKDYFHTDYILDFNLCSSGMKKDRKSFAAIEITLFLKENNSNKITDFPLSKKFDDLSKELKNTLLNYGDMNFHLTRK